MTLARSQIPSWGLVRTSVGRWELRTADQYALVSARAVSSTTFDRDGRTYKLSRVKAAQWPAVAAEIGDENPDSPARLPRAEPAPQAGEETARRYGEVARKDFSLKSLADRTGPLRIRVCRKVLENNPRGSVGSEQGRS